MHHGVSAPGVSVALLTTGCAALAPALAHAGIGAAAAVEFLPNVVHVGDSGTGRVAMYNGNSGPDAAATNTVCNAGDPCPTAGAVDDFGISLVPSCAALVIPVSCQAGSEDPDVFAVSATGTGPRSPPARARSSTSRGSSTSPTPAATASRRVRRAAM